MLVGGKKSLKINGMADDFNGTDLTKYLKS